MGIDNIWEADGFGIAATGIVVVFAALTFISLFIYLLPILLSALSVVVPASEPSHLATTPQSGGEEEIVAAIGFALHQRDAERAK